MKKKQLLFFFLFFFLTGILYALLMEKTGAENQSLITGEACRNVTRMNWEYEKLFIRCILKRGLPVILLPLFIATGTGLWIAGAFGLWFSFSMGALMEILALQYGLLGVFLFISGVFPHYLFYFPAYVSLLFLCCRIGEGRKRKNFQEQKKRILQWGMIFGVVIIGAFFESYVNPFILKGFIKLFFAPFYYI